MYTGLGVDPATAAVAVQVGKSIWDGIFGDTAPDHDAQKVAAWGAAVAGGQTQPCPGPYDLDEVMQAVYYAPEGQWGDPSSAATRGGLRQAIVQRGLPGYARMQGLEPYVRSSSSLARVAVGVAHGMIDCGVGWQEQPTVEHLDALLSRFRNRSGAVPYGDEKELSTTYGGVAAPAASPTMIALALGALALIAFAPTHKG